MARRFLFLLAAFGITVSLAAAQPEHMTEHKSSPGGGPERGWPGGGHARMMQKLNLTDQQKDQLEKLHAAFQKKEINTQAKIRSLRVDLRQAAMAENPDRGAIEKIVSGISDVQRQSKMDLIDHLFSVRALLTPEQQKLWKMEMMSVGMGVRRRVHERIIEHRGLRSELPGGGPGGNYSEFMEGPSDRLDIDGPPEIPAELLGEAADDGAL